VKEGARGHIGASAIDSTVVVAKPDDAHSSSATETRRSRVATFLRARRPSPVRSFP
jgi:hypothetical protein